MRRRFPTLLLLILALHACGCANILFERGPYAIRGLEVVYSEQEDVTFFFWRLRGDAKLDRVSFELWLEDDYQTISLSEAPFPTDPYQCGAHWCFQYQVPGEYDLPDQRSPMRSFHEDEGIFMGPGERTRRVQTTFGIDPIALGHNDEIDPNREDWFADNDLQLRRDYEWQFASRGASGCDEPRASDWTVVEVPIGVSHSWTDRARATDGLCFLLRPVRRDAGSPHVQELLVPSAETTFESQRYAPPRVESPIVWGMLVDLEIPNETRCRQVKGAVIDMIESSIDARGENRKLGIYTPLDSETGDSLGGCDQAAERDYPFEQMLRDAETARAEASPEEVRVLWIFVNNIELPPPDRVVEQLELFGLALIFGTEGGMLPELPEETDLPFDPETGGGAGTLSTTAYTWAIGSNVFMNLFPWDETTPWRPVEDETFRADVESLTETLLPFTTMLHTPETEVEIETPQEVESRPLHFKICDATPLGVEAIGIQRGYAVFGPDETVPWPEFDDTPPFYRVPLPEQILVPFSSYVRRSEEIVVEVCTAFCSGPFRTQGGAEYENWTRTSDCQWQR